MRRRSVFILLALMFAMLFASAPAQAIEEALEKIVQEIEFKQERRVTTRERNLIRAILEEAQEEQREKINARRVPKEKTYYNNTVCSFGPQFREISSSLTRDWYMFTPVDLSKDGEQTFELIGGGMYVIGSVTVTVKDGAVQVDYEYNSKDIVEGREYFTFFADYDSVTREDLNRLPKHFTYGKSYSIEEKLGGDTDVLLFVCNTATFEKSSGGIYRYYERNEERVAMQDAMREMIGK